MASGSEGWGAQGRTRGHVSPLSRLVRKSYLIYKEILLHTQSAGAGTSTGAVRHLPVELKSSPAVGPLWPDTPSTFYHPPRGYECEVNGDAFLLAFHRPHHAVAFCLELQVGAAAEETMCTWVHLKFTSAAFCSLLQLPPAVTAPVRLPLSTCHIPKQLAYTDPVPGPTCVSPASSPLTRRWAWRAAWRQGTCCSPGPRAAPRTPVGARPALASDPHVPAVQRTASVPQDCPTTLFSARRLSLGAVRPPTCVVMSLPSDSTQSPSQPEPLIRLIPLPLQPLLPAPPPRPRAVLRPRRVRVLPGRPGAAAAPPAGHRTGGGAAQQPGAPAAARGGRGAAGGGRNVQYGKPCGCLRGACVVGSMLLLHVVYPIDPIPTSTRINSFSGVLEGTHPVVFFHFSPAITSQFLALFAPSPTQGYHDTVSPAAASLGDTSARRGGARPGPQQSNNGQSHNAPNTAMSAAASATAPGSNAPHAGPAATPTSTVATATEPAAAAAAAASEECCTAVVPLYAALPPALAPRLVSYAFPESVRQVGCRGANYYHTASCRQHTRSTTDHAPPCSCIHGNLYMATERYLSSPP